MIKKVIAGVLSAVLCSTALLSEAPRSNSSTDATNPAQTAEQQSARNGLEGKNSLGKYLAEQQEASKTPTAEPLRAAAAAEPTYTVTNVEFDRETGVVRVISSQTYDQKIVVLFLDEDDPTNVYRLEADVKAGEYVRTEFQADLTRLPAYFTVTAQLENVIGQPICQPFPVETYTHGMQDILEKDIHDFAEEQIVNLDEDEKTNFFVLSEDTVQAETTETGNRLVSADYDQDIYVFENADETLLSLEKGQYFYIQPNETDIIAICVQDVTADGSTVTLTGDPSADIGEMFEFIKIETTGTGTEFMESDDPEQTEQAFESARRYLAANGGTEEPSAWENLVGVYNEAVRQQAESMEVESILPKNGQGTLKEEKTLEFGGMGEYQLVFGFELPYDYEFHFYRDHVNVYTLFKIHCTISPSFTMKYVKEYTESIKNPKSYELDPNHPVSSLMEKLKTKTNEDESNGSLIRITVPTPIAGLEILFEADVQVNVSGQIEFGWSKEMTIGQAFLEGTCYPISDVKPLKWTKTNVQGEVEIKLEFNIGVVLAKLVDLKFRCSITLDILAEVSLMNKRACMNGMPAAKSTMFMPFYETNEPSVHACDMGLDLKIDLNFEVKLVVSFGFKLPEKIETAALKSGFIKLFNLFAELKYEKELTLFETLYHIGDYHVMSNKGGKYAGLHFVAQPCPNVAYRTTFFVKFTNIPSQAEAVLKVDGDPYEVPVTADAEMNFYATSGNHNYALLLDGKQMVKGSFTVQNAPQTIEIPVSYSLKEGSDIPKPNPITPITSTGPDVPAVTTTVTTPLTFQTATAPAIHPGYINTELIQFGDGIFGTLSANGVLSISGSGDMYDDMSKSPVKNVKDVRLIVMMDADEEHGYVINTIGPHAFDGMENVEIAYLPQHITSIGNYAFNGCSSLKYLRYGGENDTSTTFVLPTNLTFIGMNAFYNCQSAAFGELIIPQPVTSIGEFAFYECKGIKSLDIKGSGETVLESDAFASCSEMETVMIGEGVAVMRPRIFNLCESMTDLTIPYFGPTGNDERTHFYTLFGAAANNHSQKSYPVSANRCWIPKSLVSITVTSGTEVPHDYFTGIKSAKLIAIPDTVTDIRDRAFWRCTGLQTVTIPQSLVTIGERAFERCKKLKMDLVLPDTVSSVGGHAFVECESLKSLYIPGNGETVLERDAFASCIRMKKAVLGDGVAEIKARVFNLDESLTEIVLPYCGPTVEKGDTHFHTLFGMAADDHSQTMYRVYEVQGVWIPNALNKVVITNDSNVPKDYFIGINSLKSITLSSKLESVTDGAFKDCINLEEANLIGEDADWDAVEIAESGNKPLLDLVRKGKPLKILLDPMDKKVCMGDRVDFVVAAAGKYDMQYQWQISTDGGSTWTDADSQEPHLIFTAELEQNGNLYRCIVTDAKGNKAETAIAELIVTEEREFDPEEIEENPEEETGEDLPESEADDKEPDPDEKPEGYLPGDTDGSGAIDVSDAVLLARYCVEDRNAKISDLGMLNADVNGNGYPDSDDQTLIVLYIAKRIDEFPVGKP